MTIEERNTYFNETCQLIKGYIGQSIKMGEPVTENQFIDICFEHRSYTFSQKHPFRSKQRIDSEWRLIVQEMEEDLRTFIRNEIIKGKKRLMKKEINAVSAQCIISERLHEENLPFHIDSQTYRAKVHVKLTENRKAVIYLNYKTLRENLDDFVDTVHQLQAILKKFGKFTSVSKISSYEKWEE